MKAEQSLNVDAVSGATYSSNGVIHAVANALEIPEDQYAPRPGRNLTAKKKNHGHIVKHEITSQEEYEEKVEKYSKWYGHPPKIKASESDTGLKNPVSVRSFYFWFVSILFSAIDRYLYVGRKLVLFAFL